MALFPGLRASFTLKGEAQSFALQRSTLATCGRMACSTAAEDISHFCPRPKSSLKTLFRKEGPIQPP